MNALNALAEAQMMVDAAMEGRSTLFYLDGLFLDLVAVAGVCGIGVVAHFESECDPDYHETYVVPDITEAETVVRIATLLRKQYYFLS